ncbi:transcriptional regulator [Escherichia coli]|uniref:Transcriptional regulator n=1 Tax=Escherichia coli TaxID=562 RepID=A0A376VV93_ECOLX|nr:transcriptional regulator [Escherichia coli]
MNTDDAIFGTGYFVVGKIEKINAAIRGRNSLLTAMVWDALPGKLPEQSSTILVLNKAGRIQWGKGRQPDTEEVDHVIALAQKLINE